MEYTKEQENEINRALEVVSDALDKGEIEEKWHLQDGWRSPLGDGWRSPLGGEMVLGTEDYKYRAKPAPEPLRERWIIVDREGGKSCIDECLSEGYALYIARYWDEEFPSAAPHRVIHMREVRE